MDELAVKKSPTLEIVETPEAVEQYGAVLKELGLHTAAKRLDSARRLTIAYAKYGHVTEMAIQKFQQKLHDESLMKTKVGTRYNYLRFTPIGNYGKIPPVETLGRLREAVKDGIFDSFEVADIASKEEIPDPIIFGRIEGCSDRFFIAQWDDDVTIEEIVGGLDATPQGSVEKR